PVIQRFCGVAVLPGDRTLSRWLSRCVGGVRAGLHALNGELIAEVVQRLKLKRITLDVDGTVVSTGLTVERAFRGYNPHHRKVPSYYPITAYLAQTGHLMRVRNRSGNVHDGKASLPFLRDLFAQVDGHWEYSAITTNKPLGLRALWKFMAGRGTHEKVLAQLKNGFAFDVVPTRSFAANSTWQILSVLAHNLITNFQIALAARPRPRTSKRRSLFLLRSIHTLRYEFLGRAG